MSDDRTDAETLAELIERDKPPTDLADKVKRQIPREPK